MMSKATPLLLIVGLLGALAGPLYVVAELLGAPPAAAAVIAGASVGAWFGGSVVVVRRPGVSFETVTLALAMMAFGTLVGPTSGALHVIGCPRALAVSLAGAGLAIGAAMVALSRDGIEGEAS